VKIKDYTNRR